ncbi:hypothetical protein Caci_4052 [Catenulispora acidiphila DSM 44928]|uniref:Uncharacterized protein n=1 Tax=Catenulispora acidiphila (strain DSM 44928 / JCM 14897 / NBRC 102108 / NRRL B-24433 / ID139908) TaxID=479433 RepID=C7QG72_CATAD|nr:hypothetical protein [Catenulispora acidiphila]ACU72917.1 hypothetical protein Caci_4052 [Catenulispora acidiphila DSM 44928]
MGGFSGDHDGLTIARLSGHMSLVLHRRWPHDAAVASVRALTGDRADLLAQWAGLLLGSHDPHRADWPEVTAQIGLLVDAGAQLDAIPGWARIGRVRQGSWADRHWPPIPDLADVLGGTVAQVRHDPGDDGHRDGWRHLVVHPLPHFRHGQDPYPALARAFGRVLPEGIGFDDRRNARDEHRLVFGLRCRDAAERLELLRQRITPLPPPGATTTLT